VGSRSLPNRTIAARFSLTAIAAVTLLASSLVPSSRATTTFSPRLLARVPGTSTVYLVTTDSCSTFCLGLFRTTNDGGFEARTAPPVTSVKGSPMGSLDRVVFANDDDGFAVVGEELTTLYATTNGARSWHRVSTMPARRWYGLVVTSSAVLVTSERCTHHGDSCGDFEVWRKPLEATHWTELSPLWKTGTGKSDEYYGPSVAAYGEVVWEQETAPMATYLWVSHDYGRTFTRFTTPRLGSVAGCSFTASTSLSMWAQCPTGMEVSFSHSSDNGIRWTPVSQHQFADTAGGDFDPVSSQVAYLDYGGPTKPPNLYRLTDGGRRATSVGELDCTEVSLAFTSVDKGFAICTRNDTTYQLLRTTDGGAEWSNSVLYG
jgi:hypothetical protein